MEKFGKKFKCFTCNYATNKSNNLKKHKMTSKHKEKMFKSSEVDFATKNSKCLKKPRSEVQSYESIQNKSTVGLEKFGKIFKCSTCIYTTDMMHNLKKHQLTHSNPKPFKCTLCDFTTNTKNNLLMHCKRIHDVESIDKFKCSLCDYTGRLSYHLLRHQLVHCSEKPFKCSKCDFATKRKNALDQHNSVHYIEKPFKCSKCDFATKRKKTLDQHNFVHYIEKPFKCPKCDYAAKQKQSLKLHLRNIHAIKDGKSLQQHQTEIHSDVNIQEEGNVLSKKFEEIEMITAQPGEVCQVKVEGCVCSECSGECSSEQFLQDTRDQPQSGTNSIKTELFELNKVTNNWVQENINAIDCLVSVSMSPHQNQILTENSSDVSSVSNPGPEIDVNVQTGFATKNGRYPRHQTKIHSPENFKKNSACGLEKFGKKFKCFICNYATDMMHNLKEHQLTHSSPKPLKCTLCDFTTNTKYNLLMHWRRIHDVDSMKKFKCSLCDYTARLRYHLLRHQLVHSSENLQQPCSSSGKLLCVDCNFETYSETTLIQHFQSAEHLII